MLGIAYAGSIGGVATLIGTPPNAVLAGMADELLAIEVSFAGWLAIGVPVAAAMLILCWTLLSLVLYRLSADPLPGAGSVVEGERAKLGGWGHGERVTAYVFAATALAWVLRSPKEIGGVTIPGIQTLLPDVGDATIAMAGALALFLWPTRDDRGERTRVLDWATARSIPWDILILFGGGLSLASAFESTGLTGWLGGKLVIVSGLPPFLVIGAVAILFVLLTELTSNTATATLGLPVVAALAPSVGTEALPLMTAAAMSASMAFMLPVATPPNAIVYGTGRIDPAEMRRAGLWLNLLAVTVVTLAVALFSRWTG
jgi:sodium-dependent dicarboxylate transporter 2/3/5